MSKVVPYNRNKAVEYALTFAFKRNPNYLDFSNLGGDCTNFISQCLYAGSGVMNYTPVYGWYYGGSNNRSASWTGVTYLYNFLTTNTKAAVFGKNSDIGHMQLGDIIQLGNQKKVFYHSLIITDIGKVPSLGNILISTHTFDASQRPLSSYVFEQIRYIHIEGVYIY